MNRKNMSVKVRFAPSPTGFLHIGSLRTALFNWLFAKHHEGSFFVRIEDTDLRRSERRFTEAILHALEWVGLHWDGGIIYQSDRVEQHNKVLKQLVSEGKAYRCYCTTEDLMVRLNITDSQGDVHLLYDEYCRERQSSSDHDGQYVIRFKLPKDMEKVSFNDLIRGSVVFDRGQLDDFIIARSDGTPVYNFVVVVDDAYQEITHIIRGEDHISNTPKQILLANACGYQVPYFAHVPLILNSAGSRLSKREAATSVWDYKETGYLPDALINYLARLGWSHGDQEIFSRDEMVSYFSLESIGKKASIFDMEKLQWFNGVYIRKLSAKELLDGMLELRNRFRLELVDWDDQQLHALVDLYKTRVVTLIELANDLKSLHDATTPFDITDIKRWITQDTIEHLQRVIESMIDLDSFTLHSLQNWLALMAKQLHCKLVALAQPIRIALVGKSSGPGIFELLSILGKQESVKRLQSFVRYLQEHQQHAHI